MEFKIDGRGIGDENPPYVIAELSANHNGSIERAKKSIQVAKESGAHAVKFQTYTPDTMTIDCNKDDFIVKGGLWAGYKLYDLYKEAYTPFEWHKELFEYANSVGITAFSTPFDESALELLEKINAPAYKIASFELQDVSLIKLVAETRKPILISTGMATMEDVSEAVEVVKSTGNTSLLLFHCISAYPTPIEYSNLKQIITLKNKFNVPIGLSDHTIGNIASIVAVSLGACAIEKHFTINRLEKGPDSEFSLEPHELSRLICDTFDAWRSLGTGEFVRSDLEANNKIFRRSLYFVKDKMAGEKIMAEDIRKIRPGYGLSPKNIDLLLGKTLKKSVSRGDPVLWEVIKL